MNNIINNNVSVKSKGKLFTTLEVANFRRLTKVYSYSKLTVDTNLFNETETLTIYLKEMDGTDTRNMGNIARLTKSRWVAKPENKYLSVTFKKMIQVSK